MKNILLVLCILLKGAFTYAQNPVEWKFFVDKVSDTMLQIHLRASLQEGWHIYAQTQPKGAIPKPTVITFNKNPLIKFVGKVKELGNMDIHRPQILNTEDWRYADRVDFVQLVQVKNKVKTNVNGMVCYMVCTDQLCLPPTTIKFNLSLKN